MAVHKFLARNTAQHSTAQHSTAQYGKAPAQSHLMLAFSAELGSGAAFVLARG